jgi:hypothetical protein
MISGWRSWVGRVQESRNGSEKTPAIDKVFSRFEPRMYRFRYLGDYYYAYQQGWMDIFADTSAIYADFHSRHGLPTVFAPWGATPRWYDDLGLERDIDVLWMGTRGTKRRSQLLDRILGELETQGVRMHIADGENNPFIFSEERTYYLNRSKITLNFTRTWYDDNFSRLTMAASNRSLIISEPILPHCPCFDAGTHYVTAPANMLATKILYYLEHEKERQLIVDSAYRLVTSELTFQESIKKIMNEVGQVYQSVLSPAIP